MSADGTVQKNIVNVCGAGPAGLSAALTLATQGHPVAVFERRPDIGGRFHGDYQGLENWTTREDVLDVLAGLGIRVNFECTPFRELMLFDPQGREALCRAEKPLFYLVRRGNQPGTLDYGLKQQALEEGVRLNFNRTHELQRGGIMAAGPLRGDIIALGYVFETDMADGIFAAVSNDLAPHGYAYLLVQGGRGTLATCMFTAFKRRRECLERCVEFFSHRAGLRMQNARRFGGIGTVSIPGRACREGVAYAGEAAGFQDALFGFGMRYALLSGHLAASAMLKGAPEAYDTLWRQQLAGYFYTGAVNRWMFEKGGHTGYRYLVWRVSHARDPREWLRQFYAPSWLKSAWYRYMNP